MVVGVLRLLQMHARAETQAHRIDDGAALDMLSTWSKSRSCTSLKITSAIAGRGRWDRMGKCLALRASMRLRHARSGHTNGKMNGKMV